MCGIAGLFLKSDRLQPELGALLTAMTATLCSRGPDSAGFALYSGEVEGVVKLTLASFDEDFDVDSLAAALSAAVALRVTAIRRHTHIVLAVPTALVDLARVWLGTHLADAKIVSEGAGLEIFKDVGDPNDVAQAFAIASIGGTHGIAHTRMATESAVTTDGAHPFSTGRDQCLVHNGSLSNHASLRRELVRQGVPIRTDNDSEVAAGYLTRELRRGRRLGEALKSSLEDLDGFFTFVVGTRTGFGVLRDPIACKPAIMAETADYVSFASEYRSLTCLPGIASARVFEPKPAMPYFWEHSA